MFDFRSLRQRRMSLVLKDPYRLAWCRLSVKWEDSQDSEAHELQLVDKLTSILTLRTEPEDSATKIEDGLLGSAIAPRILDFRAIGLPFLFPAFASLLSRLAAASLNICISEFPTTTQIVMMTYSVSKNWSGRVPLFMVAVVVKTIF